jgi:deoxyribodipyrimidine photo-lyase
VVTDDFPCFFLPRMVAAAGRALPVALEAVDSNGLLPMRATTTVFPTAYGFRRLLQTELPRHLADRPAAAPLRLLPRLPKARLQDEITRRWPHALEWLDGGGRLETLPINRQIAAATRGGATAARQRLAEFLSRDFPQHEIERNHPDHDISSHLSPYLHWGHLSVHEVFDALMTREGWLGDLPLRATGAKAGWWGVSAPAERFLDELVTWRELGFNLTSKRADYAAFESLPDWARRSLEHHADDPRDFVYTSDAFERAQTHDPLWNAAQRQLMVEGRIHTYLRMLWGKKILEWSPTPREALTTLVELNNKYALDGRDPNSYSGIFWVLGRYDRPWHPERPVFGVVRYMSSANTARKMRVKNYLRRFAAVA